MHCTDNFYVNDFVHNFISFIIFVFFALKKKLGLIRAKSSQLMRKHLTLLGVDRLYRLMGGARGVSGWARGVMVIVVGIGPDDTSSNPGRD